LGNLHAEGAYSEEAFYNGVWDLPCPFDFIGIDLRHEESFQAWAELFPDGLIFRGFFWGE